MSHPTAYENFKVIIEGSVYDADLTGDVLVVNRSETMDLAILARKYEIQFILPPYDYVKGSIVVDASLAHLAEELLFHKEDQAAAQVEIGLFFQTKKPLSSENISNLTDYLHDIWGKERLITINASDCYVNGMYQYTSQQMTISFNRVVTEDQADDLYELIHYCTSSLEILVKKDFPFVK